MAYQALARKWRPQDFASLIGQEPVVTALRNALVEGRIAQAYLFAGIRGVGKTTAARVLAKALNCEKGPAADPCNECRACQEITAGADLDVLEIDAATYSKVEQVRELTDSLRYGPAHDRYKVVVLDEVHRLSRQAFDALLKIVEEPPPHLVFVFATTEAEAVPATILSRCQEFRFRRVPIATLAAHLEELCRAEGITASPSALRLIARAGEGSVRDSVALLDQLATYGGATIADEDAARLLGGYDIQLFHELLAGILGGRGDAVAQITDGIEREGLDPRQLFTRFLGYCRDALHLALGGDAAKLELPGEESARLQSLAREHGYENVLRLLHQLLAAEPLVRRSEVPGLALEIALLRGAELPKLRRVEELLGGGVVSAAAPSATASSSPAPSATAPDARAPRGAVPSTAAPATQAAAPAPPAPRASAAAAAAPARAVPAAAPAPRNVPAAPASPADPRATGAAAPPAAATPSPGAPGAAPRAVSTDVAAALQQAVTRRRQVLAAHLAEAQGIELVDGELRIYRPPGDGVLAAALERNGNRAALEEALLEVCGPGVRWRLLDGIAPPPRPAEAAPAIAAAATDPSVQAVLDIFGGTIAAVEKSAPEE